MTTTMKKLTAAQVAQLVKMAGSASGMDCPPGGTREAGRSASAWWRVMTNLRQAGLVDYMDAGTHRINAAGRAWVQDNKGAVS